MVVVTLGSCLEDITKVGMDVEGFGSREGGKRGLFDEKERDMLV